MAAVPMKPEYGPTLGQLLAPRWRAASRLARVTVAAAGVVLLALLAGVALTLMNPVYSHGGPVPFSFSYRGLYRVKPDPGGYVKVHKRSADGALQYSFAVSPLTLPPYTGELSAELPMYAATYVASLRTRYAHDEFQLRGEGKAQVHSVIGYDVLYTALVEGRPMYGRDILLLPEKPGVRQGVVIAMLTAPGLSKQILGPLEVASTGVLMAPLRSFTFE
jgi:hypothetical protein